MNEQTKPECAASCCCEGCDPELTRLLSTHVENLVTVLILHAKLSPSGRATTIEMLLHANRTLGMKQEGILCPSETGPEIRPALSEIPEAIENTNAKAAVGEALNSYAESEADWASREVLLASLQVSWRALRRLDLAMQREIREQEIGTAKMFEAIDSFVAGPTAAATGGELN